MGRAFRPYQLLKQLLGRPAAVDAPLPSTPAEISEAARAIGMTIPETCMPGVVANMALLGRHADILRGTPKP